MLLIDSFLGKPRQTSSKLLKRINDPYLSSGLDTIWLAGELGDNIIFSESTIAHSSELASLLNNELAARALALALVEVIVLGSTPAEQGEQARKEKEE